jgi:hypothetical protein
MFRSHNEAATWSERGKVPLEATKSRAEWGESSESVAYEILECFGLETHCKRRTSPRIKHYNFDDTLARTM